MTMGWSPSQTLQDGRYRLERTLGMGGFGITYLAWDNRRLERVVIKTLNAEVQADAEFPRYQRDFLNEALRLAKCQHPHIVQVHELIEEDGLWGMVMEYIPGQTLATLVQHEGALAEADALCYVQQIGAALMEVHAHGLLHRDVKPVNILVRPDRQQAVLIDFGLARDFAPNTLQQHTSYGTDGFAPIEQYNPMEKRGAFTDVYALAATLYVLVTGIVPLCASVRAVGRTLDPPRRLNPSLSPWLNDAILRGMALRPEDRPQTIADWLGYLTPTAQTDVFQPDPPPSIPPLLFPSLDPPADPPAALAEPLPTPEALVAQFLSTQQWSKANQATTLWLMASCGRDPQWESGFTLLDVDMIPAGVIRQVDQLWRQASQNQFGLRIQRHIYGQCQRDPERFGHRVGWLVGAVWLCEDDLRDQASLPAGHWPTGLFSGASGGLGSALLLLGRAVFNHYGRCGL
ncbi:MAG: hypothetical protein OHK0012_01410 [Synechococcales cyanobacterium]